MENFVPIDFEYNSTTERKLNLVCCSLKVDKQVEEYWLYQDKEAQQRLKKRLLEIRDRGNYTFVCFNGDAEGSSFISLGLNPAKCKWVDLQNEWKQLINKWDKYRYGEQLIDGKEKKTYPPVNKYTATEKEKKEDAKKDHSTPNTSLAAFLYKILNVKIDTDHKTQIRNIIIANNPDKINFCKKEIMDYCSSDIAYLGTALAEVVKIYKEQKIPDILNRMHGRGETSARVAIMSRTGYPVNIDWVNNLTKNVPILIADLQEDINRQFPDSPLFSFKYKTMPERGMKLNTQVMQDYITNSEYKDEWPLSEKTGKYSLKDENLQKYWSYKHTYPEFNLAAQYVRYKHLLKSLNGFLPVKPGSKSRPFTDFKRCLYLTY
jgi:hypothetical protein